ncbi:MAG: winged helix-turn-helix domain-containing protein [Alphaproteobacteria bacterium]
MMSENKDLANSEKVSLAHAAPFSLGPLSVRPATREVQSAGGRVVLEPRVMQVLVALARAKGEVVTRDDLIAACWGRPRR